MNVGSYLNTVGCLLNVVSSIERLLSKVVFYWDQPFKPQPISVETRLLSVDKLRPETNMAGARGRL